MTSIPTNRAWLVLTGCNTIGNNRIDGIVQGKQWSVLRGIMQLDVIKHITEAAEAEGIRFHAKLLDSLGATDSAGLGFGLVGVVLHL